MIGRIRDYVTFLPSYVVLIIRYLLGFPRIPIRFPLFYGVLGGFGLVTFTCTTLTGICGPKITG
jgi:hypothetical protein